MSDDIESRTKEILSILGEAIPEEKQDSYEFVQEEAMKSKPGKSFVPAEPTSETLKNALFELEDDDLPEPPRLEDVFKDAEPTDKEFPAVVSGSITSPWSLIISPEKLEPLKLFPFECWGKKFFLFKDQDGKIKICEDWR